MTDKKALEYTSCNAIMGTLTNAQKAQKALSTAAIPSRLEKINSSSAHRGCVWSIQFSCNQTENARRVLTNAGITPKSWEVKTAHDIP